MILIFIEKIQLLLIYIEANESLVDTIIEHHSIRNANIEKGTLIS